MIRFEKVVAEEGVGGERVWLWLLVEGGLGKGWVGPEGLDGKGGGDGDGGLRRERIEVGLGREER